MTDRSFRVLLTSIYAAGALGVAVILCAALFPRVGARAAPESSPPAASGPTPPHTTPSPDGLTIALPGGVDRRSFVAGLFAAGAGPIDLTVPACGGKRWLWRDWREVPVDDVPCACTIETFKECRALRWTTAAEDGPATEAMAPDAQSSAIRRSRGRP